MKITDTRMLDRPMDPETVQTITVPSGAEVVAITKSNDLTTSSVTLWYEYITQDEYENEIHCYRVVPTGWTVPDNLQHVATVVFTDAANSVHIYREPEATVDAGVPATEDVPVEDEPQSPAGTEEPGTAGDSGGVAASPDDTPAPGGTEDSEPVPTPPLVIDPA